MLTCSVCGLVNDDLSVVCSSCKSYLQGRVDALNLFESIWGLMEAPSATFKRIVLARHKNYALLLSSLFGICLTFEFAWYKNVADRFPSLLTIVTAAIVAGPIIGIAFVWGFSLLITRLARIVEGKGTRRNCFAAVAYATFPMTFVLVFVIPIQIAVFGIDFFGSNPPPMVVKPLEYVLLLGIKSFAALWTVVLLVYGIMAVHAFDKKRLLPVTGFVVGLLVAFLVAARYVRL